MTTWLVPLAVLAVIAIGIAVLKQSGLIPAGDAKTPGKLPYRKRDYLLSKAEQSFYGVLRTATRDRYAVFAKVRLLDLVYIPRGVEKPQAHRNRVMSKHADFVLCDPKTLKPLLVIELDDASHQRQKRQDRDAFVDRVMQAAGLPLLHVPARRAYETIELARQIDAALAPKSSEPKGT